MNLIFERTAEPVKVYREVDLGDTDSYGKSLAETIFVGEEDAIVYFPGRSPGGARPERIEARFGERVKWEPHILFRADSVVQETDVIEWGLPQYPKNPNAEKQLWEVETLVPRPTHLHGQLQRLVEQG
ncbi:hypothetical protein ACFQHN_09945 [Natrialbaceae archaeon GCM10025896]